MKTFFAFIIFVVISFIAAFFIVANTYGIAAHTGIFTVCLGCAVFAFIIISISCFLSVETLVKIGL